MVTSAFSEKKMERIFLHRFPLNSPSQTEKQTRLSSSQTCMVNGNIKTIFGLFLITKSLQQRFYRL